MRNLDERVPPPSTIDFYFAARQCFGRMREGEELLPSDDQIGNDAGRAAVKTCVRRLLAIYAMSRVHLSAHLIEPRRQPLDVTGCGLRIEATGSMHLAGAQPGGVDVAG